MPHEEALCSAAMRRIAEVTPASATPYPVWCGDGVEDAVVAAWPERCHAAVVVADRHTQRFAEPILRALEGQGLRCLPQWIAPGEASKTRAGKAAIEDAMLAAGIDRRGCVVAVGGGVVLDLAGFVAATFMRGIPHLNVATSLLAQVDAAIGGKTAINTPAGKNLIGAFHHPRAVFLHTAALGALPPVELRNGLAESVKHAVLWDRDLMDDLEAWSLTSPRGSGLRPSDAILSRCVGIKAEVVAADDRDLELRNILNFGHTVAHAIEGATEGAVAHGHAVAIGMVLESRLAAAEGRFPQGDLARLVALLERLGLPTAPPCPFDRAAPFFGRDKKTEDAVVRCAIPQAIGRIEPERDGRYTRAVSLEALRRAWDEADPQPGARG